MSDEETKPSGRGAALKALGVFLLGPLVLKADRAFGGSKNKSEETIMPGLVPPDNPSEIKLIDFPDKESTPIPPQPGITPWHKGAHVEEKQEEKQYQQPLKGNLQEITPPSENK